MKKLIAIAFTSLTVFLASTKSVLACLCEDYPVELAGMNIYEEVISYDFEEPAM